LSGERAVELSLEVTGLFSTELAHERDNLVLRSARALAEAAEVTAGAALVLDKRLPVASGIGGGSADAAAALRLLTSLWNIDPKYAQEVAPKLGSDVPACLFSLPARGDGPGDELTLIQMPELSGTSVLLVNPRVPLSATAAYAGWDGMDRGPLDDWREGRNDLEGPAIALVPQIASVLAWVSAQAGVSFVRMSGSGATCFALFDSQESRDMAAVAVPREWWHLGTFLR
jgi:4-diphosphocytidyl-2-C-methyl-D-erythritol kinase